ncbi:hypothetical protein KHF85_06830 [Xanthomonas translucens pv. graminis]|uniref:hypothetical protein n=1 Tax=Xanthomonas graminis TaxID=3390026 RepID=UPI00254036BB|nr:hypothetical protein [Xanthomonas translucens]WIH06150.1 hypothetical protein KHF85_06830 [Xanthomonas translucens pv. graminis]
MPWRAPPGTYAIAITVVGVAIASVAAWRERPTDAASARGLGDAIGHTAAAVAARSTAAPITASAPAAPTAARIGDAPHFDGHGQLLPDPALRRYLDRYLTALDAPALATQRRRLDDDLAIAMPAAQAQQVLAWFDRYAAYLRAAAAASARGAGSAQHAQALRERLLGPQAAAAFFADASATR